MPSSDYTRRIVPLPEEIEHGGAAMGSSGGDGPNGIEYYDGRAQEGELPDTLNNRLDNPEGWLYSVDGVDNVNGNVEFIAGAGMTITADNVLKTITFVAAGGGVPHDTHLYFPPQSLNNVYGDYATTNVGGTGNRSLSFKVPEWVTTIKEINVWCIPIGSNAAADIDLESDYGAVGEQSNNHSESDLTSTYNLVAGQLTKIDVSAVFTALAAGDLAGINLNMKSVGSGTHLMYLELIVN